MSVHQHTHLITSDGMVRIRCICKLVYTPNWRHHGRVGKSDFQKVSTFTRWWAHFAAFVRRVVATVSVIFVGLPSPCVHFKREHSFSEGIVPEVFCGKSLGVFKVGSSALKFN